MTAKTGTDGQQDPGEESLSRLVAPVFAAFSLPAIIAFVSAKSPGAPWHGIVLSLLIAATGLFMASIQFSIGPLYDNHKEEQAWRSWRAGFTLWGIVLVTIALTILVAAAIHHWWVVPAVIVLLAGGTVPGILILREKWRACQQARAARQRRDGTRTTGSTT